MKIKDIFSEQQERLKIKAEDEYHSVVVSLIREKFSTDDELAILRQKDSKQDEFQKYNAFCEKCKEIAKERINDKCGYSLL